MGFQWKDLLVRALHLPALGQAPSEVIMHPRNCWTIILLIVLGACSTIPAVPSPNRDQATTAAPITAAPPATAPLRQSPVSAAPDKVINLDALTQSRIAQAKRVVFVVPFSHWDTDWHATFANYSAQADLNILDAIRLARQDARFRYAFEQVLFVQHFWQTHPEARGDLVEFVHKRQLTFAWAGITQPETSLASPTIQVRNLQLGQDWITETFGAAYVPHTAWQADAFGNNAALPILLARSAIKYLFIGRWQHRCDPDYAACTPLPHLFQWRSPVSETASKVLVAYQSYSQAFGAIEKLTNENDRIMALRQTVAGIASRTNSKYLFLPWGDDFWSPLPDLALLVDHWNVADPSTLVVIADPETAFDYSATEALPEIAVDMNPIWQAFYATRPAAKIADKESDAYLTANDKFGVLLSSLTGTQPLQSTAWYTATVNAHYDNIGAVSYDRVWETSQQPRFDQTIATAAADLSHTLAQIAVRVRAPLVVFNPLSWPRSGVVELQGRLPDAAALPAPIQKLGADHIAVWVDNVPAVGYVAPSADGTSKIEHPATITHVGTQMTLANGLVTLRLDGEHGGTFGQISLPGGASLLRSFGDDVTYINDRGDVYGAFFGEERARESRGAATLEVLADGPLIARAQAVFELGGQAITKTVTLHANSPQIDVELEIATLPETTAIVQIPTTRAATLRTDDMGFGVFVHAVDDSPIVSGTVTYRREVFYPITAWGDVSAADAGITLLTHGLQGLGGTQTLNLMLGRQVTKRNDEGVTDRGYHTLRYAYLPHASSALAGEPWLAAYAFNQPLIPIWHAGNQIWGQIPWQPAHLQPIVPGIAKAVALPPSASLISATNGIITDLYRRGDHLEAVVLNYEPSRPTKVVSGANQMTLPGAALTLATVSMK
ncbi:MAG: hypothetical protein NVS4B8_18320 [Herpetosiphon sp.]